MQNSGVVALVVKTNENVCITYVADVMLIAVAPPLKINVVDVPLTVSEDAYVLNVAVLSTIAKLYVT